MRHYQGLWLAPIAALLFATAALAQQKPAEQPVKIVPLKVEIVLSEYAGTKEISRLPYTLAVNAGDRPPDWVHLRLGDRVPIATGPFSRPASGQIINTQFQYQDVGTNIDCAADALPEGTFKLELTVVRSSVDASHQAIGEGAEVVGGQPIIRQFRVSNFLILRDGQTDTSTIATDPVSGHVLRVTVTLHVVKQ
jgi:hypothetical protein